MTNPSQRHTERSLRLEGLATYLQGMREQERAHLAREPRSMPT